MNKTINPELVLRIAKAALPQYKWRIRQGWDSQVIREEDEHIYVFHPLIHDSDAFASENYLERHGWMFRHNGKFFIGEHNDFWCEYRGYQPIESQTKEIRVLACFSAMTGLPLYLEDKQ